MKENKTKPVGLLPNGSTLFVADDGVGGRVYWSDEVGGGVHVWTTSLVDTGTLLTAMAYEEAVRYEDTMKVR